VRFCRSERIERCQKVLLAFAGSVIGSVQGRVPEQGIIIHGPKYRLSRLRLDTYQEELSAILDQLWELLDGNTIPPPVLNSHCDVCQFQPRCRREAVEVDHLSLLKGMSEEEIYRHNSKGIFTVTQLSYTFRLKRRPKRAKLLPPSHSYALQALAKRQKQVFVHGVPDIPCAAVNVYFDIEGIPDRNLHYLIGMVVQHNGRSEQFSFWADHADEEEAIFRSFLDAIPMHQDVRLFHYGSYETAAMRRIKGKMPLVYQDRLGQIQKLSVNVLNVVYHHFYFPVLSNSLKEVAGVLGFKWTEAGSTGLQSIVWREEWEKTRDQALKGRLCVYNRDDCLALQHVTEFMRNAMSTVAEGSAGANAPLSIESTDSLKSSIKKRHEFGSIEFVVPEFDAVNRCAYFDYQRE